MVAQHTNSFAHRNRSIDQRISDIGLPARRPDSVRHLVDPLAVPGDILAPKAQGCRQITIKYQTQSMSRNARRLDPVQCLNTDHIVGCVKVNILGQARFERMCHVVGICAD